MKITTTDERGLDGARRIAARVELESSFGISGVGYGDTPCEAACAAIDALIDGLDVVRESYAPRRAEAPQRTVDAVVADVVALAREAHDLGLRPVFELCADAAFYALVKDRRAHVENIQSTSMAWDRAEIRFAGGAYNANVRVDSDTRDTTPAADPIPASPAAQALGIDALEEAANEAAALGAAAADLAQAETLYGKAEDGAGPGGGDAVIAEADEGPF